LKPAGLHVIAPALTLGSSHTELQHLTAKSINIMTALTTPLDIVQDNPYKIIYGKRCGRDRILRRPANRMRLAPFERVHLPSFHLTPV
jgi:hypothetical protein